MDQGIRHILHSSECDKAICREILDCQRHDAIQRSRSKAGGRDPSLLHEYEISVLARGPLAKGILSDRGIEKARDKAGDGILEYDADEVMSIARDWKK